MESKYDFKSELRNISSIQGWISDLENKNKKQNYK